MEDIKGEKSADRFLTDQVLDPKNSAGKFESSLRFIFLITYKRSDIK